MNQAINTYITGLNNIGQGFWSYAAGIFIQANVLIVLLLIIDFLLRKRVRAVFRYCLWMLLFVKLVLPASFTLPTGIGYWLGDYLTSEVSIAKFVPQIEEAVPMAIDIPQGYIPLEATTMNETTAAGIELEPICWQGLVFSGWLVGMLVLLALLVQRVCFVRGLIAQSKPANERLLEMLDECRCLIGIRQNIELRLSGNTLSPAVCGLFKPIVLMPDTLLEKLSQEKLKAVLIHELAHIKRADVWVNLLQTMLQIVYFYNPLVWIANAMVSRAREQAVDEMVLVTLKPETKNYSNTLIDIAEMAFWRPNFSLRLIGVVESKKALERRIKHMLNRPVPKSSKLGFLGLFVIVVIGAILLPMGCNPAKQTTLEIPVEVGPKELNEAQRVYMEWTEERFADQLDRSEYADLSESAKAELEEKWIAILQGPWNKKYYNAINSLAAIKSKKAVKPLLKIAAEHREKDNRDRWMATRALGIIGDDSVVPELIHLVYHYNQNTRFWAQISLVRLTGENFGIDWQQWGKWWNNEGRKPAFSDEKIEWTTRWVEYADPQKQKESDRKFVERFKDKKTGATEIRRRKLRDNFRKQMEKDRELYTEAQIQEISALYQVANKKWNTQEAKESLKKLINKYTQGNRVGCAMLYLGQMSSGQEREDYLKTAIEKYSDCWYGDGVQVGAYARYELATYYQKIGKPKEANKLFKELIEKYPNAVDHQGHLLLDSIPGYKQKAHIQSTSTIDEDGRIVDKIDYPFVNDSQIIGTWESVDFVDEMEQFKVGEKQWKGRGGELFLNEMIFGKNGRLISKNDNVPRGYPGTWTKGLVIYDNDTKTASKYTLKDIEGSTYMFYEWKSGDYTIRHRKPSYYVLKKKSSDTASQKENVQVAREITKGLEVTNGLGFLMGIPEFRDLRLKMTEHQLVQHLTQYSLAVDYHKSNDESTYHLYTETGENVIVMFHKGLCTGIQRMQPDSETAIKLFEEKWLNGPKQTTAMQVEEAKGEKKKSANKSQNEIRREKLIEVRSNPQIIHNATYDLFERIKNADYDYFLSVDWEQFPIVEYYNSYRDYPELVRWICKTFKENPIVSIELDDVSFSEGWPRIYYKLILKDGAILEGDLHFEYHFYHGDEGRWHGIHGHFYDGPETSYEVHGLDWHLQSEPIKKTNVQG